MSPASVPLTVRLDALVAACFVSLAVGLAGEFGWRWFSIFAMDAPTTLASIENQALVLNAVMPVAGNGLGYFMTHRRPTRWSRPLFVGPGVLLAGVGLIVSLAQLPVSPGPRAVVVTVVAVVINPIIVVTVLLTRKNLLRLSAAPVTPIVE